jgi:AmmeMemoRadiSam system protein B
MKLIEEKNRKEFGNYLKRTKNTICGSNPIKCNIELILVLLALVEKEDYKIEFVCYQQSSKCIDMNDSSVSYAAAKVVAC